MERHMQKYQRIGMNIAKHRKIIGLSQLDLAEKANISRTHISRIEAPNTQTSMSLATLFDIAEALGIDVIKLFENNPD